MKIEFLESFITGHPVIDAEHRQIVDSINHVSAAITAARFDLCPPLLDEFLSICIEHFATEERLLRELNYPDLANHIVFHKALVIKARAIKALCNDMHAAADIRRCFDEMATLLIEDVVRGDLQFLSFLIERKIVPPRDQLEPIAPLTPRRPEPGSTS